MGRGKKTRQTAATAVTAAAHRLPINVECECVFLADSKSCIAIRLHSSGVNGSVASALLCGQRPVRVGLSSWDALKKRDPSPHFFPRIFRVSERSSSRCRTTCRERHSFRALHVGRTKVRPIFSGISLSLFNNALIIRLGRFNAI